MERVDEERDRDSWDIESADDWTVAECGVYSDVELGCGAVSDLGAAGGEGGGEVMLRIRLSVIGYQIIGDRGGIWAGLMGGGGGD